VAALSEVEFLALLRETGALLEGHFLLSSGLHSSGYIQCACLLQHPKLAGRVGVALAEKANIFGPVEAVVGPALGGIIVAHELARALGARGMFTERAGEKMTFRRGFQVESRERVLIAEDVVTTGHSAREVALAVGAQGGQVVGIACLVDRRGAGELLFPLVSLAKMEIETYPPDACPLCEGGLPLLKPGSRPSE
jgi:orotate phosphoribosyltransferase